MSIIPSNYSNKNDISSSIDHFFKRFNASAIARKSNAQKSKGVSFLVLFSYLVTTIFSNRSTFRDFQLRQSHLGFCDKTFRNLLNNGKINWQRFLMLLSKQVIDVIRPLTDEERKEVFIVDDSMYDFRNLLNNGKINWQRFLMLLSKQVIDVIRPLTDEERKEVFIVDDSMYERLNAKQVELCGWQYDHVHHKHKKGFRFLQLGWSDGNTFLPVSFSLLSASKKAREADKLDQRTHSGKRKAQAQRKATEVLVELLQAALKEGIKANYVLFDSWFSSPKVFHALSDIKLHAVCMIKRSKKVYYGYKGNWVDVKTIFQAEKKRRGRSRYLLLSDIKLHAVCMIKRSKKVYYGYKGNWVDVKTIFQAEKKRRGRSRYLLSVCVASEVDGKEVPIKLVYVRNRNKRNDYLVLATTDTSLSEDEVIQLYGKRWSIEVYFKVCKQHLRLAKYQGLSYDGVFAHTITVAVSYLILAVQHREQVDERTMGELFYLMIEELSDISFSEALVQLLELFKEVFANEMVLTEEVLHHIMEQFIRKLPKATQNQLKMIA